MKDLINHIDALILQCIGQGQFYGLAIQLLDDSGLVYPATYPVSGSSTKITPNDQYQVLTFHRLLDGEIGGSEVFSFGRTMAMENNQRVRMVVLVDFSAGETVIDNIINALPEEITNVDYKSIVVSDAVTLIRDRDSIWNTEWGNAYKDKYQMRYNIYAVEYSISYIRCADCVES